MREKIGRYTLGEALGSGAHGAVWKAQDGLLDRTVALKLLKKDDATQAGKKSSLNEAKTLAKLSHPNIVTLYEVSRHRGQTYLVMEYLNGTPLNEYLARGGKKMPRDEAIKLATQIIDALKTAHAHGIVHADIKPANIIIQEGGLPVLLDFGLARTAQAPTDLETMTGEATLSSMVLGTLAYMSPEVMRGESADEKSDIFSFGAVFYEMLHGKRAFKANSDAETINQVLNVDPDGLEIEAPDTDDRIADLLAKMLSKNRTDRPESFAEIQEILQTAEFPIQYTASNSGIRMRYKSLLAAGAIAAAISFYFVGIPNLSLQSPSIAIQMSEGLKYLRHYQLKGSNAKARSLFQDILTKDPENAAATAGLSLSLFNEYKLEKADPAILRSAIAAAALAYQIDDQLAIAQTAVAWGNNVEGKTDEARDAFKKALDLDPNNFFALIGYTSFLKNSSNRTAAIPIIERASKLYPETAQFYIALGDIYYRTSKHKKAESLLRKALEIEPDNIFTLRTLSAALYAQGDTLAGISILQQGLQIRPHSSLYGNLGTFYFTLGQYAQAVNAFERAVDVKGDSHNYIQWANLADAYSMIPDSKDKARIAYVRALQLLTAKMNKNEQRPALISRASLYSAKAGQIEKAKTLTNKALELSPTDRAVLFRAAVVYDLANERDLTLDLIERAINAGYSLTSIKTEPDLAALRSDPRYQLMMARIEGG